MKKIMFVCHGNICRSPMAEFIFKKMLSERGLEGKFSVASSATSREEIVGNILDEHDVAATEARRTTDDGYVVLVNAIKGY